MTIRKQEILDVSEAGPRDFPRVLSSGRIFFSDERGTADPQAIRKYVFIALFKGVLGLILVPEYRLRVSGDGWFDGFSSRAEFPVKRI